MTGEPVAVVSDLHLSPDAEAELFDAFDETAERLLESDPAELVVLGDVLQGSNPEDDRRLLRKFAARLEDLSVPHRVLPGNHDVDHLDHDTFCRIVGHDRWRIDPDAGRAYLDTSAPRLSGSRGEVDESQLSALRDAAADLREAVVFVHHPVHYAPVRDNYWFGGYPEEAFCGNKRAVREILEPIADRVSAVVNGHLHEWHYVESDGLSHFTVDAFNKRRHPTGETGAYALLRTDGEAVLEHRAGDGTEHRVRLPE